jgi:tetratricopeptide (TPR) repeat protein
LSPSPGVALPSHHVNRQLFFRPHAHPIETRALPQLTDDDSGRRLVRATGDLSAVRAALEDAVAVAEGDGAADPAELALLLHHLGCVLHDVGAAAEARSCLERALHIHEALCGSGHSAVARDLRALSQLLLEAGELTTARRSCERALAIDRAAFGGGHQVVATDLLRLAHILWDMDDRYGADWCFTSAQDIQVATA